MPKIKNIKHFQKTAEEIAIKAGKISVSKRHSAKILKSKSDFLDIVTEADEASEEYIVKELKKQFPTHNIYSEESGDHKIKSDFSWTIDPLDGTKEYARGQTLFYVVISLEYRDEIVVGVVYAPVTDELYSAVKGKGATLNGKKISVSKQNRLDHSILCAHPPRSDLARKKFNHIWRTLGELCFSCYRIRLYANDIYHFCQVATGAFDGFYIPYKYPDWWDIAAGIIIVKEAGGVVTTAKNNPLTRESFQKEGLIASNGRLHKQLIQVVDQLKG